MSPATLRIIGVVLLLAAALLFALNLARVAGLSTFWVALAVFVVGLGCLLRAKKRRL